MLRMDPNLVDRRKHLWVPSLSLEMPELKNKKINNCQEAINNRGIFISPHKIARNFYKAQEIQICNFLIAYISYKPHCFLT